MSVKLKFQGYTGNVRLISVDHSSLKDIFSDMGEGDSPYNVKRPDHYDGYVGNIGKLYSVELEGVTELVCVEYTNGETVYFIAEDLEKTEDPLTEADDLPIPLHLQTAPSRKMTVEEKAFSDKVFLSLLPRISINHLGEIQSIPFDYILRESINIAMERSEKYKRSYYID